MQNTYLVPSAMAVHRHPYRGGPSRVHVLVAVASIVGCGILYYRLTRTPPYKTRKVHTPPLPAASAAAAVHVTEEDRTTMCGSSSTKAVEGTLSAASVRRAASDDEDNMFCTVGGPLLFLSKAKPGTKEGSLVKEASRGRGQQDGYVHGDLHPYDSVSSGRVNRKDDGEASGTHRHCGLAIYTQDVAKRTKALGVVRALLKRVEGVEFDGTSDDDTESDETDVSLNYHIATELEMDARDELLEELDLLNSLAEAEETHEPRLDDYAAVLGKMAEYLDISNERDKLQVRREEHHFLEQKRATASAAPTLRGGLSQKRIPGGSALDAVPGVWDSRMIQPGGHYAERLRGPETGLDQQLLEYSQSRGGQEDVFESEWYDEDDDEGEADFMAYLEQNDSDLRFYSRDEMRRFRHALQNDFQILGHDWRASNEIMADVELGADEVNDWEDVADELSTEDTTIDGEGTGDRAEGETWTAEEKASFEQELLERISDLAMMWGVTEDVGQKEALIDEVARHRRQEARAARAVGPTVEGNSCDEWSTCDDDDDAPDDGVSTVVDTVN